MTEKVREKIAGLLKDREKSQLHCDFKSKEVDRKLAEHKTRQEALPKGERVKGKWPDISAERNTIDKITLKCSQHYPDEDTDEKWEKYYNTLHKTQCDYMNAMRDLYQKLSRGPVRA